MIYVFLDTIERQMARIRQRVASGGHDVPVSKVSERRFRSFAQLAWFARHVDKLFAFDNSGGEPELSVAKVYGPMWLLRPIPVEMRKALATASPDVREWFDKPLPFEPPER